MASAVAVKGVPLAGHELPATPSIALKGVLLELPVAVAPSVPGKPISCARCLLSTKGAPSLRDDDTTDEEPSAEDAAAARRRALDLSVPKLFSTDALDQFGGPTNLTQMLALMGNGGAGSRTGFSARGWWVSKEDDEAMQLKVVMPGLEKEQVKVLAEKNILVIEGEGNKDPEDCKGPSQYSRRFQLPAEAFKMDQIKAEMNNGVLKVTVPKIKPEERKDVFQIKVE